MGSGVPNSLVLILVLLVALIWREGGREGERKREREKERKRDREKERKREREKERMRERDKERTVKGERRRGDRSGASRPAAAGHEPLYSYPCPCLNKLYKLQTVPKHSIFLVNKYLSHCIQSYTQVILLVPRTCSTNPLGHGRGYECHAAKVIDCDEGCMVAIYDCIEEGCSVISRIPLAASFESF